MARSEEEQLGEGPALGGWREVEAKLRYKILHLHGLGKAELILENERAGESVAAEMERGGRHAGRHAHQIVDVPEIGEGYGVTERHERSLEAERFVLVPQRALILGGGNRDRERERCGGLLQQRRPFGDRVADDRQLVRAHCELARLGHEQLPRQGQRPVALLGPAMDTQREPGSTPIDGVEAPHHRRPRLLGEEHTGETGPEASREAIESCFLFCGPRRADHDGPTVASPYSSMNSSISSKPSFLESGRRWRKIFSTCQRVG